MTRSKENKQQLLELLREIPSITVACKRAGISRATCYRWMQDFGFKKKADEALSAGRIQTNDGIESILIKKAMSGDMPAIKYWLMHNDLRYMGGSYDPMTGEPAKTRCNLPHTQTLTDKEMDKITRWLSVVQREEMRKREDGPWPTVKEIRAWIMRKPEDDL